MTRYVGFLRAVNVGGSVLKMSDLAALSTQAGLTNVRTVIQSGNVLFDSASTEKAVQVALEAALEKKLGKRVSVFVRSHRELRAILVRNPFKSVDGAQVGVMLLDAKPAKASLEKIVGDGPEAVIASGREIFIHYPHGMGRTKLKFLKGAPSGTVRNINTLTKIQRLLEE